MSRTPKNIQVSAIKLLPSFTNQVEQKLANEIGAKDVTVYFQFKPSPRIWIQTPEMHGNWVREPLKPMPTIAPSYW